MSFYTLHYYGIRVLRLLLVVIFIVLPIRYTIISLEFLRVIIRIINFYLNMLHSLSFFIFSFEPLPSCYVYYYNSLEYFYSVSIVCNLFYSFCLYLSFFLCT
jgi:hypothetical protein